MTHINLSKELGGGEHQTLALIQALGREVHSRIIVRRHSALHHHAACLGEDEVEVVPVANSPIAALRKTKGADLLHIHEGRSVQVGAMASHLFGTPFIVTRRVSRIPSHNFITRGCFRSARKIVAVSGAIGERMRSFDHALSVETVYDCVRPLFADQNTTRDLRSSMRGKLIVGHVGTLDDSHKGQRLILDVARRLQHAHPRIIFVIIGDGKDEKALRARANDLPNVHFTGHLDNVGQYYAAMDVFVFPSRSEGPGSAILEAMSFGLPVVASRIDGIPEIVQHEVTGLLFPPNDTNKFGKQLLRLATNSTLRATLGARAKSRASEFSAQNMADKYLGIYADAIRHLGTQAQASA